MLECYNQSSLENGLKIISSEKKDSNITTIELWVKAGPYYESKDQLGYTHFLEHMLSRGTKKRPDSFALNVERDRIGAYYSAVTGTERVCFVIQFIHKYAESMMELLSDMVANSLLDPRVVENEKKIILEELHRDKENKSRIIAILSAKEFFGGHPLSNDVMGTVESITGVNPKKLREYKEAFFIPSRSAIVTTGKITHGEAVLLAKKYFGNWLDSRNILDALVTINPLSKHYVYKEDNSKQTYISLNYSTLGSTHQKETAAFNLITQYLRYGHSSLLIQELRNLRGLVYDISVNNVLYGDVGRFIIATSTTRPEETIKVIFESMSNLSNSLNADKLEEIKIQKINTLIRLNEDILDEAAMLGWGFVLYGRLVTPEEIISQINQVTHNDIKTISKKYLVPQNSILIILGPKNIADVIDQSVS